MDDDDKKAGKGLKSDSGSSGSGKTRATAPAAAEEPTTKPEQVETAERKVEKKDDEQVGEKDLEKANTKDMEKGKESLTKAMASEVSGQMTFLWVLTTTTVAPTS